jgi:hypothetical protein
VELINSSKDLFSIIVEIGILPVITIILLLLLIQVLKSESKTRENYNKNMSDFAKLLKEILFIQRLQSDIIKIILGDPVLFQTIIKHLEKQAVLSNYNQDKENTDDIIEMINKLYKTKEGLDFVNGKTSKSSEKSGEFNDD